MVSSHQPANSQGKQNTASLATGTTGPLRLQGPLGVGQTETALPSVAVCEDLGHELRHPARPSDTSLCTLPLSEWREVAFTSVYFL